MNFNIDFNLVRSQKLLLNPQLKQAIEVLEMSSGELLQYIENQLATNPALEEAADSDVPVDAPVTGTLYENGEEDQDFQQADIPATTLTLKDYLLLQLNWICPDKCSYMIGVYLVDNTDDNGYLKADVKEVAECMGVPETMVLEVLEKLQSLEPPGICARDLRECLLLQLKQMEETDDEAILIVDKYLDALANDDAGSVALATGIPVGRIRKIFKKVRSLEPRPGREFFVNAAKSHVIPDVVVRNAKNGLQVIYNDEAFPAICLSENFILNEYSPGTNEKDRYFRDRLNNAVWLIKCLEQREHIIFTIAQKLCESEKEFFNKGPKALKLLDRPSFAASMCLHEAILEKALNGKYLQCRWGLFEFGSFFSDGSTGA